MGRTSRRASGALVVAAAALAPLLTATPAQAAGGPTVIAHRGDMAAAPESTNSAFRKAIAKGADAIEMDVRFSRTKWPVILHDATLDRTTNCSGAVSRKTLTQISRCDAGRWFSAAYRGERVPTLGSALSTVARSSGRTKVLLHVKEYPTGIKAERIRAAVNRTGMRGRIVIIADANSILTRMRQVGFTELGRVFGSSADWDMRWEYMIPYRLPLDRSAISAIHGRGGKVWPVEGGPVSLSSLLDRSYVDGVLVNRLSLALNLL
jgi:glycerophosphoryl diester phosphodiesterase